MTRLQNVASGVVHDRDGVVENRFQMLFGGERPVIRMCRPSYNAINDAAFVVTDDPITCKTCRKANFIHD